MSDPMIAKLEKDIVRIIHQHSALRGVQQDLDNILAVDVVSDSQLALTEPRNP